jgi:hypothetical protein
MKICNTLALLGIVTLLLVLSLACSQAGVIVSAAEATQIAEQTNVSPTAEVVDVQDDAEGPQEGDTVVLTGVSYLVAFYDAPGSNKIITNQERGVEAVVLQVVLLEGEKWYFIDAPAGEGWLPEKSVMLPEEDAGE